MKQIFTLHLRRNLSSFLQSVAFFSLLFFGVGVNKIRAADKRPHHPFNQAPVFSPANYSYVIADNVAVGTGLGNVSATDGDGDAVKYFITIGNTNGAFALDSLSGSLKVAKVLSHHTQNSYALTVKAVDPGGLSNTATIAITVNLGTTAPAFDLLSWGTAASQPFTVAEGQGKMVGGKLYTFGGFDSQKSGFTPTSRAYVYDAVANSWTAIAPMPPQNGTAYGGVTHAGFATDGTDIYFAGGYTSNSAGTGQLFGTKEVWKYVVAENRYERLPNLPVTISTGQLEYLSGKLHYIAGTSPDRKKDVGTHYVLDLDNQAAGWKTLAPLPNPRQHAASAVYEGKIYFIGGQHGHDDTLVTQKDVHRYDPATDTWTKVADLPVPAGANGRGHLSSAGTVFGNQIIVMGGEIVHGTSVNMVSAYDPAADTWTNLTPLPSARYSGVAANLGGKLYYAGGSFSKTTYKGLPGVQQVISFTLINADTDQPIQTLASGNSLNIGTLPTRNLAIRANTNFATGGSVKFSLTGAQTRTFADDLSPYALYGDNNGDFVAWTPKAGSYTLKATPYTGTGGTGTAGTAFSINFTVVDQPQQAISFTLINADTEQPIATFSKDSTINLANLPTRNLNIRTDVNSTKVGSVAFNVSGTETRVFTDNVTPFAFFEDNRGDYYDWTPTVGSYTLKATPYTAIGATGTVGLPLTVQLNVIDQPNQQVTSFTLINADSDSPIQTITSGSTVNLSTLTTQNLNIRANTNNATSSVVFSLSGPNTRNFTDDAAPFALFGHNGNDFAAWTPAPGHYLLKATPYAAAGGTGVAGPSFSIVFAITQSSQNTSVIVSPIADAYVRDGATATTNFGLDTILNIKGSNAVGNERSTYLKFPLTNVSDVVSAKLRLWGRNAETTSTINASVFGVSDDSWAETGITWNNAPSVQPGVLGTLSMSNQSQYYEVDVTSFVKAELAGDKAASFQVSDPAVQNRLLAFNSRENLRFQPQLVLVTSGTAPASGAALYVENLDKFPSNNDFAASKIQVPWGRDSVTNTNHDTVRVRLVNRGQNPLLISNLSISDRKNWKIVTLAGTKYDSAAALPFSIPSGSSTDVQVRFNPPDSNTRVRIIVNEMVITSNDDEQPRKTVYLRGLWQREGEDVREPRAQEILQGFGFKTKVGFSYDPDKGANNKPKGDEVLTAYFVRADASRPVTVRQMSAYHGCCDIQAESLRWYPKGSSSTLKTAVSHVDRDAQTFLPRRSKNYPPLPAEGSFNPTTPFGFKVGSQDWSDTALNTGHKIGLRVWRAIDPNGRAIPNTYIVANDYLGSQYTNYDYNDNIYYVTNVQPELGPASTSTLVSTPSAVDFGEQLLQSNTAFTLNLKSLGQVYPSGAQDPAINISAISIVGDNADEFTASTPVKTTLAPGESTTLTLGFKPTTEGLKIADLLIYYNNAASPYRVPLYGIAKASGSAVTVRYRVKSGSSSDVVVNGKTWMADTPYAFDNLEPYTNNLLTQISATDEDVLYLKEQSSNGDKKPFRYEFSLPQGTYWVRLHFAEIYWGNPGSGLSGGSGSRVMSVAVEGQQKLLNFDVAGTVGSASALVKNIPVTVTDGKLNINFSASVNRPMICAIEVYQFTTAISLPVRSTDSRPVTTSIRRLKAFPNPVHDNLTVNFSGDYKGNASLQLADAAGRLYELGKIVVQPNGTSYQVNLARLNLKPGVYFLRVNAESGKSEIVKLFVQ